VSGWLVFRSPALVEYTAGHKKEAGRHGCDYAKQPEYQKANAITGDTTDVVFQKQRLRIERGRQYHGCYASGDERWPENSDSTLDQWYAFRCR
jgi:hypothetical protein